MSESMVPFLDLRAPYQELRTELDEAYHRVMNGGYFLLGAELNKFEREFAEYSGTSHAVGVASGLDALILALQALDIGPGDEVIVPSHTFIATWLAVSAVGAEIVPVEPSLDTYCITAQAVELAITSRTAAVVPVHLYGLPCEMEEIESLLSPRGIPLIADAAQAHGSMIHGTKVGSFGTMSAWSFYPGKNLGAFADAGAVTTDSDELAFRLRSLRNYGSEKKYVHNERGLNSRLDELQAAFLTIKLRHLDDWNARRRVIAGQYLEAFKDLPLNLPPTPKGYECVWHLFVVRTVERDLLQKHLKDAGIETLIHYPTPIHQQSAYRDIFSQRKSYPVAEELAQSVLSLPIGPHMTAEQVELTIDGVRTYFG